MMTDPGTTLAAMKARAGNAVKFDNTQGIPRVGDWDVTVLHQSLLPDAPRAYAALDAVLERHRPDDYGDCSECDRPMDSDYIKHPCPTVRSLTEHLGDQ